MDLGVVYLDRQLLALFAPPHDAAMIDGMIRLWCLVNEECRSCPSDHEIFLTNGLALDFLSALGHRIDAVTLQRGRRNIQTVFLLVAVDAPETNWVSLGRCHLDQRCVRVAQSKFSAVSQSD